MDQLFLWLKVFRAAESDYIGTTAILAQKKFSKQEWKIFAQKYSDLFGTKAVYLNIVLHWFEMLEIYETNNVIAALSCTAGERFIRCTKYALAHLPDASKTKHKVCRECMTALIDKKMLKLNRNKDDVVKPVVCDDDILEDVYSAGLAAMLLDD